jgi:hypothetical protein
VSDFDSPWKEALELYFRAFMAFFFPQAHREIDWSRGYEILDKELQQVAPGGEQGWRVVDKLVKVWRLNGEEAWVLIHIEVQSQEEADFPQRMYVYNYRLFDRYNRMVISLAVLGDERRNWRPDHFGYSLWGCTVRLDFPVVKLLDYADAADALEASTNPFATVVLAHLKTMETRQDPVGRQAWKFRLVKGLYEKGFSKEDVRQLFRFIDWMMELPEALTHLFREELDQLEKEKTMPYVSSVERLGIAEGLRKGIEALLRVRFGEEGLKLLPEIKALSDVLPSMEALVTSLEALLSKAETAQDLQEVRAHLQTQLAEGTSPTDNR